MCLQIWFRKTNQKHHCGTKIITKHANSAYLNSLAGAHVGVGDERALEHALLHGHAHEAVGVVERNDTAAMRAAKSVSLNGYQ